jgi:hypothetical protein
LEQPVVEEVGLVQVAERMLALVAVKPCWDQVVETTCSALVVVESHSVVAVERRSVLVVESMVVGLRLVVGAGLTYWALVEAQDCVPDHPWVALSGGELHGSFDDRLGPDPVSVVVERHSWGV